MDPLLEEPTENNSSRGKKEIPNVLKYFCLFVCLDFYFYFRSHQQYSGVTTGSEIIPSGAQGPHMECQILGPDMLHAKEKP